nr:phage tail assembly protein [uncultured Dysosmobacter sp.]
MSEENKTKVITIDKAAEKNTENDLIVKFSKSYKFEDETISEIDMSGLENLTANDMIKANKVLNNSGNVSVLPETNLEYTLIIAASATGRPVEFFKGLQPRDAIRVKNKVTSFFFGEE